MKQAVYDIINCGPRHQFWANGKIVKNCNWQNFKRGSKLRRSVLAPEGALLCPLDASQIEARVLEMLAGEQEGIEEFRQGKDPYISLATKFYGRNITKADQEERQFGKVLRLQCGFGAAEASIIRAARNAAVPVHISQEEGIKAKNLYRSEKPRVVDYWSQGEFCLRKMANDVDYDWGILKIRNKRIYVEGRPLLYETLHWHVPTDEELAEMPDLRPHWRVKTRNGWEKMWGSKLVQHIVECVSRLIVFQAGLRIQAGGHRILYRGHDELLILLANDSKQEYHVERFKSELRKEPVWLPGIPLDCEAVVGKRYLK